MTTYIKRVPPIKAVQFYVSKETIQQLMHLLGYDWSWTIKGGNGSRVRITFENAKPVDDGNLVYVAEEGDWIVVFSDGSLPQVMANADFKAQYEAAPEAKAKMDELREEVKEKQRAEVAKRYRELMGQQPRVDCGLGNLRFAQFTTAGACMRPDETVDQANQRMNREMQNALVGQAARSKHESWGGL